MAYHQVTERNTILNHAKPEEIDIFLRLLNFKALLDIKKDCCKPHTHHLVLGSNS
jgi:hypothetical protein